MAFKRQQSGSVVCPSCGRLVGVSDEKCGSCGRPRPSLWGFSHLFRDLGEDMGFTKLLIGVCGALYLVMLVTDVSGIRSGGLMNLLSPSPSSIVRFGATGVVPVIGYGRWWSLLSAVWLHGGLLHVGFNMYWAYQLVPPVARLYGPGRTVIVYLGAGLAGFVASTFAYYLPVQLPFLAPAYFSLGASGAILGLLGALVYCGRRTGSSMMLRQALGYAVALILFGFVMAGVDNWAHIGGFVGGYALSRVLDPLKPERIDHVLAAIALLVASGLAVLASVVVAGSAGLPVLGG